MKSFLIGCGVVMLILVIGGVVVGVAGYKFFKTYGSEMVSLMERVQEVNGKYPYFPQQGQVADPQRVDAWLGAFKQMEPQTNEFGGIFEKLEKGKDIGPGIISKVIKGAVSYNLALAESLDQQHMSFVEYYWIMSYMIATFKSPDTSKHAELAPIVANYKTGLTKLKDFKRGNNNLDHFFSMQLSAQQFEAMATIIKDRQPQFVSVSQNLHKALMGMSVLPQDVASSFSPSMSYDDEDTTDTYHDEDSSGTYSEDWVETETLPGQPALAQ